MQKLKAVVYLKNNKKRAAILVISFGLFFCLLYVVRFFIHPAIYMDEMLMIENAKKMQTGYINNYEKVGKTLDNSLWEPESNASEEEKCRELNRAGKAFLEDVRNGSYSGLVYLCYIYNISVKTFIGNSNCHAPMLKQEEFNEMIQFLDIHLSQGRFPEQPGEMLVDERILKSLNLSIGDNIYDEQTTIVGATKYENYFAAGIAYDNETFVQRYLFFVNNNEIPDMTAFLQPYGIEAGVDKFSDVQILSDQVNAIKLVEDFKSEMDTPLNVMTYTLMTVLAITLFFVYRLHIMDRYSEWCLYRSLGFTTKEVYFLAFREYGICFGFSILLAGGITAIACYLGGKLMDARGMMYEYLLPDTLFQIFSILVLLTGIMQLPVVVAMRKVRTIDAMETD